jgi:KAP family P-loop domain
MRILPIAPKIDEFSGLSNEQDLFKLRPLADGMTNLVSAVEDPMVIAFDGPWGSGKSTFLRQWAGELRTKDFPVILFDAFENDYVSDAFAALAREIVELIDKGKGKNGIGVDLKKNVINVGKLLLKSGGKIALKVGTRVVTAGMLSDTDIKGAVDSVGEEVSEAYGNYMEELLDSPRKQKETIASFKVRLSELPSLLSPPKEDSVQRPLVFIIDELDRCRPSFALELIEKVKHFMSVPHVHFVLGVNLEQLRESVKVEYGPNINAQNYLQKFITLSIFHGGQTNLGENGNVVLHAKSYGSYLSKAFNVAKENQEDFNAASNFIVEIVEARKLSLREMERIYSNLALALAFTPANFFRFAPLLGGLCALKTIDPMSFSLAKRSALTIEIANEKLGFKEFKNDIWAKDWWEAFLEISPGEKHMSMLKDLSFKFSIDYGSVEGRRGTIAYLANEVVDRFISRS